MLPGFRPKWKRGIAAAATMLLGVAPATTAATDAPTPTSEQVTVVDASTLPPEELQGLDRPTPYGRYLQEKHPGLAAPQNAPAATVESNATLRQQCAQHPKEVKTAKGWIKNRFKSCQSRPYDLVLRDLKGTKVIGRMQFDVWVLGIAHNGSRRVDYTVSIEDIKVAPVGSEDATKWKIGQFFSHSINIGSSDPNPAVEPPSRTSRFETLTGWHNTPSWTLTYTSPDSGKVEAGNPQRVSALVSMDVTADSPNAKVPYKKVGAFHSGVRFDRAGARAGKYKGTVFTEARVELTLSLSDTAIAESTRHIRDAQDHPERTFPSFAGKTIPGKTEPLHRLIDEDKQEKNRKRAISTCEEVWGNYKGTRLQCDEYPYASTKEGANAGDDRYSARLIDGKDNEAGGRRLNSMYTANRVLDGDPFYVKITP